MRVAFFGLLRRVCPSWRSSQACVSFSAPFGFQGLSVAPRQRAVNQVESRSLCVNRWRKSLLMGVHWSHLMVDGGLLSD